MRSPRRVLQARSLASGKKAVKELKGFVVKTRQYDPPAYKSDPSIQFKQRIYFTPASGTTSTVKLSQVLSSTNVVAFKISRITAWLISKEGDDINRLTMSFQYEQDLLTSSDIAGANHHSVVSIRPPLDDWYKLGATNEPIVEFSAYASNGKIYVDFDVLAKINVPEQEVVPTLKKESIKSHSFGVVNVDAQEFHPPEDPPDTIHGSTGMLQPH